MGIVAWLVVGLIAGYIARAIVPGPDPMGIGGTLILGLAGSLVGGFLGNLLFRGDLALSAAGLVGSIIGAVIALVAYRRWDRSRVSTVNLDSRTRQDSHA